MPHLQLSKQTARNAHAAARAASAYTTATTPLQQAHFDAIARANKIAAREHNLITTFALSSVIEEFKAAQLHHSQQGEMPEAIAYNRIIARLKSLIPTH